MPHFHIFRKLILFIQGILLVILFYSCNTTKKLHKGEYLLNNNKIIYRFGSAQKSKGLNSITNIGVEGIEKLEISRQIAPSEILPYIKQKPNTRILFAFPFYLFLYNLPDSVNTARAKSRRDSAYVIKARKKGWSEETLKRKMDRKTGREWIMSQGEAPVILDTSLTSKSTEQIKTFLFNKGYFNATVKDSIHIKEQKADVSYIIKPGKPFRIRRINYFFEDPTLASEIYTDTTDCVIRRTDIYDQDNFDAERDRLTAQLNNSGYYFFSKNYVHFSCDTDSKNRLVDVTINIKKFALRDSNNKDSIIEISHPWYRIRHVTIQMQYNPTETFYQGGDTLLYDGLTIVYPRGEMTVKPKILRPKIFVTPGDIYRIRNRDDTYTGLSQLGEFSYVSVKYAPVKDSNYVDSYIQLMPIVKYSFGYDIDITNTGGDGGVQGDISYFDYNLLKGAEKLQFKLNGGLIAQKLLTSGNNDFNKYIPLNTIDLGPELDLAIPRPLFPFNLFSFARRVNPQTSIKLSYDYQQRPDYLRHLLGVSYSFDWNPVKNRHITLAFPEINFVSAILSPSFVELLQQYNLFFQNSFKNQFITDIRLSGSSTNQNPSSARQKQFDYFKINIEPGIFSVLGFSSYTSYAKVDGEWRHYWILDKKQKIVHRLLVGAGLPFDNSSELPFTKSFWAGGSNDIRAWQIQTLGPGGSPSSAVAGQVGEIKYEQNLEYRVSLIKYFGMALFADWGNIWLIRSKANAGIPLAYMGTGPNPFYSEIAVGTGIGFRFDFNYFVFRLDLGNPIKDPALPAEHRWIDLHESIRRTVLNIGVGYPF